MARHRGLFIIIQTTVTDLNNENIGGVPCHYLKVSLNRLAFIIKSILKPTPVSGLDWHFDNKLNVITCPKWDVVVMHGYSTLDAAKPGDPTKLIDYSGRLARAFKTRNPNALIYLTATWSRADLTYRGPSPWNGAPIEKMGQDVREGYGLAASTNPQITQVIGCWRSVEYGVSHWHCRPKPL